jgi:purine-binding chemotaxis protein CheW
MEQRAVVGSDGGTPPPQSQYLTFRLGEEEYGVPILAVHEIKGQSAITPLPNAPPCIPGVMNLRGTIVPVVDLRAKFGLPDVEHSRFTVIVLVVVGTKIVGMRVDAVTDVVSLAAAEIQAVPDLGGAENGCVSGLARTGDKLLVLLDVDKVLDGDARVVLASAT